MKLRKMLSLLLAVLMAVTAATFTFGASAADNDADDLVIPYHKIQKGVVDHINDRAFLEKVEDPEKGEVFKIVPNPDAEKGAALNIDGYDAKKHGIDVTKYKYLIVEYKLHVDTAEEIHANMNIMTGGVFSKTINTTSVEPLVQDQWTTMSFNIRSAEELLLDPSSPNIAQLHFMPFGSKLNVSNMKTTDYILVGNWTFTAKNPTADKEYNVTFRAGNPKATGKAPDAFKAKADEILTLPKIEFVCEGKKAAGWLPSTGSTVYDEGAEFIMPPSNVEFAVNWKDEFIAEDLIVLEMPSYVNEICEKRHTATLEKGVEFEGRNVVKVIPDTTGEDKGRAINLDGWGYGGARMNVDFHNTIIVLYKYESKKPVEGKASLNVCKQDTFSAMVNNASMDALVANRWASASFSMAKTKEKTLVGIDPIIKQLHYYPFGYVAPETMDPEDRVYVYKMIATPMTATGSAYHESFIKGYDDGTFGISGNMTRAEACTIVARLVAGSDELVPTDLATSFTDVNESDWFNKYIAYCESLGYLGSYSGTFLPNQNITRAEFVELVYNMGLLADNEKNGTFTDVTADHPRYAVITAAGKAGLVNGYPEADGTFTFKPDNTITRAEVVKVINNAYGKTCSAEGVFESVKNIFKDVEPSHWAYADILDAAVGHVSILDEEGKEVWVCGLSEDVAEDDFDPDYAAGEKFLQETEAKIDARRDEIRNSKSDYKEATGKIWYVSNKGSDENDGTSAATPVATIKKAHELAGRGDAVLFERGGMWRGSWASKSGVIYSAYGEGPKPIMNGNVEGNVTGASNWTLVPGTTNVYKYKNALLDVGNIIYNEGEKTVEKIVPKVSGGALFVEGALFDPKTSFKKNDTFISTYETINDNNVAVGTVKGDLYVRCDEGNPGAIYSSIELATKNHTISGGASNVIFDNLCIKYSGNHGVGGIGGSTNVTFRNCEIGYIGGCAQNITKGNMTRYGNGVEVYGSCDGYYIDSCYVYQCYDAGITHQISAGGGTCYEKNVSYTNNLIERCIYNIEYFLGKPDGDSARLMQNILIKDNLLAKSGTGWGANPSRSASIKGWDHYNRSENFVIDSNLFFMDYKNACDLGATMESWLPDFMNNTYCQYYGHTLTKVGVGGSTQYNYNGSAAEKLEKMIGEENATYYYIKPGTPIK